MNSENTGIKAIMKKAFQVVDIASEKTKVPHYQVRMVHTDCIALNKVKSISNGVIDNE